MPINYSWQTTVRLLLAGNAFQNVEMSIHHGFIMLKLSLAASITHAFMPTVFVQAPTDHVKIDVTRAELQIIGQGLMELPYKTAVPLLNTLQSQLLAADKAAADAKATAYIKPADKSKVEEKTADKPAE